MDSLSRVCWGSAAMDVDTYINGTDCVRNQFELEIRRCLKKGRSERHDDPHQRERPEACHEYIVPEGNSKDPTN